MTPYGHEVVFQWPNRSRAPWVLLALVLMFGSAYSAVRWIGVVGAISGWIGLPQFADQIPRIRAEAGWWESLAIALPFLAALVLGFGKASSATPVGSGLHASLTYTAEPRAEKWTTPVVRYFSGLVVSILGTLGFLLVLLFIGFVFYKLGIHSG